MNKNYLRFLRQRHQKIIGIRSPLLPYPVHQYLKWTHTHSLQPGLGKSLVRGWCCYTWDHCLYGLHSTKFWLTSSSKPERPLFSSFYFPTLYIRIVLQRNQENSLFWKSPTITKASRIWDSIEEVHFISLCSLRNTEETVISENILFFLQSVEKSAVWRRIHSMPCWKIMFNQI